MHKTLIMSKQEGDGGKARSARLIAGEFLHFHWKRSGYVRQEQAKKEEGGRHTLRRPRAPIPRPNFKKALCENKVVLLTFSNPRKKRCA